MNEPFDIPVADASRIAAVATIKSVALAKVRAVEPVLRALAERYRDVVYDVSAPKGLAEAKAARHDLRENGRYAVQRAEQAVRDEANAVKKDIASIVPDLIAIVKPTEDALDEIITKREADLEAEKEAKRQAEAERVARHHAAIGKIRNYAALAQGLPAKRLAKGVAAMEGMAFGDECEDHKPQYEAARDETLAALRKMHADTLASEEEAQRLEAQRREQERVAAELAAQQAEINRQKAELERQQREIIEAAEAERREQERRSQEAIDAAKAMASSITSTNTSEAAPSGTGETPAPSQRETPPEPTIKLGEISQRLGFTLTEAFIRETLRIEPCGNDKRAVLFKASDFARVCAALIEHLGRLA